MAVAEFVESSNLIFLLLFLWYDMTIDIRVGREKNWKRPTALYYPCYTPANLHLGFGHTTKKNDCCKESSCEVWDERLMMAQILN